MLKKTLALSITIFALTVGAAHAGGGSTPNCPPGHHMHAHKHDKGKGKKLGHYKHHKKGSYARRMVRSYRR